jgi:hypothetical protein
MSQPTIAVVDWRTAISFDFARSPSYAFCRLEFMEKYSGSEVLSFFKKVLLE